MELKDAGDNLNRVQELFKGGAVSRADYDKTVLLVKSPADGMVLSLPVKQEEVVSPGALLVVLAASGQLELKADILSDDLGDVQVGQKVSITAPVIKDGGLDLKEKAKVKP